MSVASESGQASPPSESDSLSQWLTWLETIHPVSIDMGLDRVGQVADRLAMRPVSKPLILVGGTNGKGSTVTMLSAIYSSAGYRVGSYTSPHISDFEERIRIDGVMASSADIVSALAYVEAGRHPQTLTYFEYTTLAAMRVFHEQRCDVYILEVGLGGRLDATNLWDADCSVVTSIALDHQDYLGSDVSVIATEKAAIGRPNRPLVVGDIEPPASLFQFAADHDMQVDHVGAKAVADLPSTSLSGAHQKRNAGCAVAVVEHMQGQLPVGPETIYQALQGITISGRFEKLHIDGVDVLLDVAHNPAGAQALAATLEENFHGVKAQIIFACMADKDILGIVGVLSPVAEHWHCVPLEVPRAKAADQLASTINMLNSGSASSYVTVQSACDAALSVAREHSQPLLVAGSFFTIADVRRVLETSGAP